MSAERGTGGKNSNYGWANVSERPEDPAVTAWLAALWAKPFTAKEYDEMRRQAAERTRAKEAAK
jgi:hypothetical protein